MKTPHVHTNDTLLKLLGLDTLRYITSVDIAMRIDSLPLVTVHAMAERTRPEPTAAQFHLVATPPLATPPFDLDALCIDAQKSLREFIEYRVLRAYRAIDRRSVKYDPEARPC